MTQEDNSNNNQISKQPEIKTQTHNCKLKSKWVFTEIWVLSC